MHTKGRIRFGKSLNDRAPAKFLEILKRKAQLYGGDVININIREFKASQYDHTADTYEKKKLSDRIYPLSDGTMVQRDLYSAFLMKNTDDTLNKPDREKCIYGFEKFVTMQDELITRMKENNITMKQCFGF